MTLASMDCDRWNDCHVITRAVDQQFTNVSHLIQPRKHSNSRGFKLTNTKSGSMTSLAMTSRKKTPFTNVQRVHSHDSFLPQGVLNSVQWSAHCFKLAADPGVAEAQDHDAI
jgi:hypothetical protein